MKTKIVSTIWALILHYSGVSIFQTCLFNLTSNDDDEPILIGPRLNSLLFVTGVYVIAVNTSLFPSKFRRPAPIILCLYEFFSTLFILEFSVNCIWTPIDILIMTTLPKAICHTLNRMDYDDAAEWIVTNQLPMMGLSFGMSLGFFLVSIHVTRAMDLSMYNEFGAFEFANYAVHKLWNRILSELPKLPRSDRCPPKSIEINPSTPKTRNKHRSRTRKRNS